jgi:hypothetical protein
MDHSQIGHIQLLADEAIRALNAWFHCLLLG